MPPTECRGGRSSGVQTVQTGSMPSPRRRQWAAGGVRKAQGAAANWTTSHAMQVMRSRQGQAKQKRPRCLCLNQPGVQPDSQPPRCCTFRRPSPARRKMPSLHWPAAQQARRARERS